MTGQIQTVYIAGARSLLFGLISFGNKPDALNSQIQRFVNQGWTPACAFPGYGKSILFGLFKSEGFAVTFTK